MSRHYTVKELAALLAARLVGDPDRVISSVNTLEEASVTDLSFLANPRYVDAMKRSSAGAICIDPDTPLPSDKTFLITENPTAAFQKIVELLLQSDTQTGFPSIHPSAIIHPSARIGANVSIGPNVTIDQNVTIGSNTTIRANVSIYPAVTIGSDCYIHSNVTLREKITLGNRVIIQPGAVIGSCGFGYTPNKLGHHIKLEQLGTVTIEDDVEIGANTTIDRARFKSTLISRGTKIDNLCQIAHNVEIGQDNLIVAQVGIAGSTKTGRHVVLGGQVGVTGHITLSDQVQVAAQSGISKSLPAGKYMGSPALPLNEFNRLTVHTRKLEEYAKRLAALEKKLPS